MTAVCVKEREAAHSTCRKNVSSSSRGTV